MYLINAVYSAGLASGRESIPFVGRDPYVVAVEAYETYKAEVDIAVMADDIESAVVDFVEFYKTMEEVTE